MAILIVLALAVLAFAFFILLLIVNSARPRTLFGRLALRWWGWLERPRRRGGPRR